LGPRDVRVRAEDAFAAVALFDLVRGTRWRQAEVLADFERLPAENVEDVDVKQRKSCNTLRVGNRVATVSSNDLVVA
jgi:hypothetical protein